MNKFTFRGFASAMIAVAAIVCCIPSHAVLKERDLSKTLNVLYSELEANYKKQKLMMESAERRNQVRHAEMIALMKRSQQVSLMLYSQPGDYTFDITYACQQASELYNEFNRNINNSAATVNYSQQLRDQMSRYDGLIRSLESLPPAINNATPANANLSEAEAEEANHIDAMMHQVDSILSESGDAEPFILTEQEQKTREMCIVYAKALRNNYARLYNTTTHDQRHYDAIAERLSELNTYAKEQYNQLRKNIFVNGGDNFFTILLTLPNYVRMSATQAEEKYAQLKAKSDWRGPVIIFVSILVIFYIALASAISYVVMNWLPKMPNRIGRRIRENKIYQDKKLLVSYALGVAIFAIAVGVVKATSVHNNLIIMATSLMYDFAWLMFVILLSLTIRLSGEKMRHGFGSYLPFLLMAFIVIMLRIIFLPNTLINLLFPPVMLAFTIWQVYNLRGHRRHIAESDEVFSYISLAAMVVATVLSWIGYTLFAVEIMIWWSFQLAFIQTIVCLQDLSSTYAIKKVVANIRSNTPSVKHLSDAQIEAQMKKGDYLPHTWLYDLFTRAMIPVLAVISILASVLCAADIFDMTGMCREFFVTDFVNVDGVIQISVAKLYVAGITFFVFKFALYATRSLYRITKERKASKSKRPVANITLANNVFAILFWGLFFVFCLILFNVPKSGISVISAGLATGLGFAMKDLLENFFYGISLMTGRVRVGDYIECDGTFGKVESITYQSTQIATLDGSIVAFLNTSLFSKNFRNLTRNNSYEWVKVPVGVAYGSNVDEVRNVLIDHLNKFYADYKKTNPSKRPVINDQGFKVLFADFGDSSVDLIVTFWVLVERKGAFVAQVKENVYKALNNANIEIPFPQRDVHIIK